MTALVSLFVHLRRAARAVAPLLAALALGGVVLLDASTPLPWPWMAAAGAALALLLVQRAVRRHGQPGHRRGLAPLLLARRTRLAATVLDVEIGLLAVVGAFGAVLHIDGGLDGSAYAAVYVCLALASAFSAPLASLVVASLAMGLEVGVRTVAAPGDVSPTSLLPHFGFMSVFTVQSVLLLRGEIARVRQAYESRLTAEIERLRDDARSYRLLGAPQGEAASPQKSGDDERLARSGVEEIHQSVHFALRLLHDSLGLHTAMLLWQNDAGTHLRVSELCSSAQNLCDGPFLANEGIFGAALTHRTGVRISGLKPSYKLPYYAGPCPVRCAHALPVFEHGALRGVLVVDRVEDRPLSAHEQELVEDACRYAVRAIQNERVFVQLERAKAEQGKLYRAAEALGGATTEGEVVDAGVRSAREVTAVDFAAVTLFDDQNRVHEIRAVSGDGATELVGQRFRHNTGLVSMVLENRHSLPYRGEYDEKRQVVFTRRLVPPTMPSIVVLPLTVHDRPLGTLVLGSRRRGVFNDAARSTLEVLASHMAVSLSNARMLRRLEELATMDGLTGLLNKRAMLEVAEQKLLAARRFGRRMSVIIADIDLFKNINDTYGHDFGDVIIKGLGGILRHAKRTTDSVARFGGEEFVLICEETDAQGAMLLAERVREELERTTFHHDKGLVQVTCSLGIATFPEAGSTWDELFKAADESLYVSKRAGRNRVTAWTPPVTMVHSARSRRSV